MVPFDYHGFISNLTTLVNAKVIPMSRINDAVRRILRVKFVMGLFENPLPDKSLVDQLGKKRVGKGSRKEITCAVEKWKIREEAIAAAA
ncbi:hypothetical protein B296_00053197 [Ensete ventricosum]|uniref:Uncharacterized protein n=1 Tax=Ensete ventricosum TaxID=4639 RepID=A0A426Y990_ENSVE|nr:hypothetical protein B296_00053197 [Ensete ventricosum]